MAPLMHTPAPEQLYLDLMKKSLTFSLWPEPAAPIEVLNHKRTPLVRFCLNSASRFVKLFGFRLSTTKHYWPYYADTMIGLKRLDNLQECVETVIRESVAGDLIETGVWRGGACIFMRAILKAHGVIDRRVFVADSFTGLPPPDPGKHPADRDDEHLKEVFLAVSEEQVRANFQKYGLLDDQVVFLKGWFRDTLPGAPIDKLAVLRLDGDMYSSTIDALESLYPKLSKGGFCIVDDYVLPGCRQAVADYRSQHGITAELVEIDYTGRYWRKTE